MKLGPVAQEEMAFSKSLRTDGRTTDKDHLITIPHLEPSAQVS